MANLTDIVKDIEDTSNNDRVHKVASVSALATAGLVAGQAVKLLVYHANSTVGGGSGVIATARHNGGAAISLTRMFPTDWTDPAQLTTWFADSGSNELCFVRTDSDIYASLYGVRGDGDETIPVQAFFNSSQYKKEIYLDFDVAVDTTKNVVQNTDPRPPIGDGETSSAAIVINYPVKCHSPYKISALAGVGTTTYNFLISTNSEDIDLEFEIDGNRDTAPTSSLGIQVNNDNVKTKLWGGNFSSSPVVLNGSTRDTPLLEQVHDNHEYMNVGNSIFCRFVKDGSAQNWIVNDVSEGVDLDKTCDGMNLDGWRVRNTRGAGADAAIEFNGAKNCTANHLVSIDFKAGVLINAKERYDEEGVYDSSENCHADDAIIVNPTDTAINYGNVIGDHTDAIDCSTDRAIIKNAADTFNAITISGTNVSAKDCILSGGGRAGILARGGSVDISGSKITGFARNGVDTLDGVELKARSIEVSDNNTSDGGYNGLNIVDGADVDFTFAKVKGAHEYSVRASGAASITYGSVDLDGALVADWRIASTVSTRRIGSSGNGTVYNASGLNLGTSRREYYASKNEAPASSWVFEVGDVIFHTDATQSGDYQGRVCYDAGPTALFRNFGEVV